MIDSSKLIKELNSEYRIVDGAKSFLELGDETGISYHQNKDSKAYKIWIYLKKEIYSLLCTKSKKYRKERGLLKSTATPAVAIIASVISREFGLAQATATTMAAVILMIPLRLSINTWCQIVKDNLEEISEDERRELKKISKSARD